MDCTLYECDVAINAYYPIIKNSRSGLRNASLTNSAMTTNQLLNGTYMDIYYAYQQGYNFPILLGFFFPKMPDFIK